MQIKTSYQVKIVIDPFDREQFNLLMGRFDLDDGFLPNSSGVGLELNTTISGFYTKTDLDFLAKQWLAVIRTVTQSPVKIEFIQVYYTPRYTYEY